MASRCLRGTFGLAIAFVLTTQSPLFVFQVAVLTILISRTVRKWNSNEPLGQVQFNTLVSCGSDLVRLVSIGLIIGGFLLPLLANSLKLLAVRIDSLSTRIPFTNAAIALVVQLALHLRWLTYIHVSATTKLKTNLGACLSETTSVGK